MACQSGVVISVQRNDSFNMAADWRAHHITTRLAQSLPRVPCVQNQRISQFCVKFNREIEKYKLNLKLETKRN